MAAVTSYAQHDMRGVFHSAMDLVKVASGNSQKADQIAKATRTRPADAVRKQVERFKFVLDSFFPDFLERLQRFSNKC
jgi:hypothetical protein